MGEMIREFCEGTEWSEATLSWAPHLQKRPSVIIIAQAPTPTAESVQ
jgi:hypothetical protein